MPASLHPLEATNRIRDDYARYLRTIYFVDDAQLRQEFWQALKVPDFLVKGPILEASAPFKAGRSIEQLISDNVLHPNFRKLCTPQHLPVSRPLYLHQDQAIDAIVRHGHNAVVATGTGSGKTESFLIPIFDHLLREQAAGTLSDGVRALLLYPMNALANDQLKRLRNLLAHYPAITFGRYTGETVDTQDKALRLYRERHGGQQPLPNELISRAQMQEHPPHILITNYAMLEYLLLRPKDTPFFDGDTGGFWRFIALDEAHIYDGASGIEIAMLLRRLKDRVAQSAPGRLRCIATSATIGGDAASVATYASELFGEPFAPADVIQGQRADVADLGEVWGTPPVALYHALWEGVRNGENASALAGHARASGVPEAVTRAALDAARQSPPDLATARLLYELLRGDDRLHRLRLALEAGPCLLLQIPTLLDLAANQDESVVRLVELAVQARPGAEALPLLPARYHLFARALEGAFVCLNDTHPAHVEDKKPRLFLGRHEACPHCKAAVFELATCPRCGTAYLVGQLALSPQNRHLHLLRHAKITGDDPDKKLAYLTLDSFGYDPDEDDAVVGGEDVDGLAQVVEQEASLCLGCGALEPSASQRPACACPPATPWRRVRRVITRDSGPKNSSPFAQNDRLKQCAKCGARSPSGVVYRFLTGQDAPVSVLTTSLYQLLPGDPRAESMHLPGEGRKLLTFADSRQDAAFFAPYVEHTYEDILRRRLIIEALGTDEPGRTGRLRLQDLAERVRERAEQAVMFSPNDGYDTKIREARTWLMQELIALDARQALEGLGLLQFRLVRPAGWAPPPALLEDPWNLTPDEAWTLISMLLQTVRQSGAVTFPDQVSPQSDAFAPRHAVYIDETAPKTKKVLGWMPKTATNRRQDYLARLLTRRAGLAEAEAKRIARDTLYNLWRHLTDHRSVWREHLLFDTYQIAYRLNHRQFEWVPATAETPLYRCTRCFGLQYHHLDSVCPRNGCDGVLEPLSVPDVACLDNHYCHLYLQLKPVELKAQEHTAQLTPERGGQVQSEFVDGKINVLSCSTTFELGVDVGELQAVLMRNVPPTTANYVQRAGRAGRRTDSVAFVLTYAQRRSHDLTHYQDPVRIVAGKVPPPVVAVNNEKIVRRHVHSVVLAAFFRWAKDERGCEFGTVGPFFAPDDPAASGPALLNEFLAARPTDLQRSLARIVPREVHADLRLDHWGWLDRLTNAQGSGILDKAIAEVTTELTDYRRLEDEASQARKHGLAGHYDRVANTLKKRELLGFLGSRNVLPEYGFPADVVELRTEHLQSAPEAHNVRLQRPLRQAIADYAPGSQVIAAKQIWTSGGLYPHPAQDWPPYEYAICEKCGHFYRDIELPEDHCKVCGASLYTLRTRRGKYIVPEFGFLAGSARPARGDKRPERTYSSQIHFWNYETAVYPDDELPLEAVPGLARGPLRVERRYSRYGKLIVVNSGKNNLGFAVCAWCGWGMVNEPTATGRQRAVPKTHPNPRTQKDCNGSLVEHGKVHLGHDFMTDVLELRLLGSGEDAYAFDLWLSVLYALLEGASEALGIARDDLDGTLHPYEANQAPAIMLFDNVPGGAGHVRRVANRLPDVMHAAWERVSHDECGEETSCYGCLRNFYNQWCHDQLKRGQARDFLARYRG